MIDQLTVVVPACNEAALIGVALESLTVSSDRLQRDHPDVRTRIIVVLDRCVDRTAAIVGSFPQVEVVESQSGRVGAARAAGMDLAIATRTGDLDRLWLACTDADSRVPVGWLGHHLDAARAGVDLLLGTVRPTLGRERLARWRRQHHLEDGHPHVHGANLGVAAATYCAVGGFPDVAEHEDRMLADRIRALGARVVSTGSASVITSARTDGRTPGGMAGYLRDLAG